MSKFDKNSRLSEKDRLQLDLAGVHREAVKEDIEKRRQTRIRLFLLEQSGWFDSWKQSIINHRKKEWKDGSLEAAEVL